MRWSRTLQLIGLHCEGEIGKVVTGGLPFIPGDSIEQKLIHLNQVDDSLRRFLVFEPRGKAQGSVNLLLPPHDPAAQAGMIVLQADQAHAMSGSNAICMTTALLETGIVTMEEPETVVVLDTAAGLVTARAHCHDGRCQSVHLEMPDSFLHLPDLAVDVPGLGRIRLDIAFGGVFYALVDVTQTSIDIAPQNARLLAETGMMILDLANGAADVIHPTRPGIRGIAYVMFHSRESDGAFRTCTTLKPGRVDRSPCGTGSAALLAALHARGEMSPGQSTITRSTIGGEFQASILSAGAPNGHPVIRPGIAGRAWIHSVEQLGLDPSDPFPEGFVLSDCWGPLVTTKD